MWERHSRLARLTAVLTFLAVLRPHWSRALSKENGAAAQGPLKNYRLEVLRTFPHEGKPFTQGLEIHSDGHHLVETSGSYPPGTESFVRIVNPTTGETVRSLSDGLQRRFVEGIVQSGNGHWYASTYMDNKAIEYDADLNMVAEHPYPNMGWGLTRTTDGASFLATNSSEYLMTLQKSDFKIIDTKVVTCLGKRVKGLNELEMVDNFMGMGPTLLGNLYLSRLVLAVNPATGECVGAFNLDGLGEYETTESAGFHAANGLAYNKTSDTLYVTGKNWNSMFEVKMHDDPDAMTLPKLSNHLMSAPPITQAMLLEVAAGGDSVLETQATPPRPAGTIKLTRK